MKLQLTTQPLSTNYLIYFESIIGMDTAIKREKQLKRWKKNWKWNLIKQNNENLIDLAAEWYSELDFKELKEAYQDNRIKER